VIYTLYDLGIGRAIAQGTRLYVAGQVKPGTYPAKRRNPATREPSVEGVMIVQSRLKAEFYRRQGVA